MTRFGKRTGKGPLNFLLQFPSFLAFSPRYCYNKPAEEKENCGCDQISIMTGTGITGLIPAPMMDGKRPRCCFKAGTEKGKNSKRKQREEAYREYLAMREHPNANRSPKDDVKTYTRKKRQKPVLESYEEEPPRKSRQKPKQKKRRVKRIILVILLLLIILAAAGVMAVMGLMEKVGDLEIDSSNLGIDPQVAEELKDYQNIALLGIDARIWMIMKIAGRTR